MLNWLVWKYLYYLKKDLKKYDLVVSIISSDANANIRLRLKGYSDMDIAFRRQQQLPNSIKAERSNFVLSNDGSLNFLEQQIIHFYPPLSIKQFSA